MTRIPTSTPLPLLINRCTTKQSFCVPWSVDGGDDSTDQILFGEVVSCTIVLQHYISLPQFSREPSTVLQVSRLTLMSFINTSWGGGFPGWSLSYLFVLSPSNGGILIPVIPVSIQCSKCAKVQRLCKWLGMTCAGKTDTFLFFEGLHIELFKDCKRLDNTNFDVKRANCF